MFPPLLPSFYGFTSNLPPSTLTKRLFLHQYINKWSFHRQKTHQTRLKIIIKEINWIKKENSALRDDFPLQLSFFCVSHSLYDSFGVNDVEKHKPKVPFWVCSVMRQDTTRQDKARHQISVLIFYSMNGDWMKNLWGEDKILHFSSPSTTFNIGYTEIVKSPAPSPSPHSTT